MEPDYGGAVHLIKNNDDIYGILRPFGETVEYSLVSLGGGKNALIRYSATYINEYSNCAPDEPEDPAEPSSSSGPCYPVQVLVLYTPEARNAVANIDHEIDKAMQLLDGATYNSLNVLNAYTKFQLAGKKMIPATEYTTTGNIQTDITMLSNNTYAKYYRDQYKADIVICLTNAGYENNPTLNNKAVGRALVIGPNNGGAYAILEAKVANAEYIFSHEVGHVMGCRHQQSSIFSGYGYESDNTSGYDHGYGVKTGFIFTTPHNDIMHVSTPNGQKEHYFSTPGVILHGKVFGDVNDNWAAKTLLDNSCTVSEFRDNDYDFFDAAIQGSGMVSTGNTVSLTGVPYFGYAGFTYEWYVSFDGGNNWIYNTTNSVVPLGYCSFTMPDVPNAIVWLKATDGVSQVKTTTKTIFNTHPKWLRPTPGPNSSLKPSRISNTIKRNGNMYIMPNPAVDRTQIAVNIPAFAKNEEVFVSITDILGRVVANKQILQPHEIWEVETSDLPSGTYFVCLKSASLNVTNKLSITK